MDPRCFGDGDPLYAHYHDEEWGRPVTDERGLYERLSLEAFQSGLSWLTILRKREAFRAAFADFAPDAVARFGEDDVRRLLADAGIVRNRAKIEAAIANARATVDLRAAGTPLDALVWEHRPAPRPAPRTWADVPARAPESVALARALKRAGFRFVGPTTLYALMQACGLVNDHLATCPARPAVERAAYAEKRPASASR
jgi:DNA-3-methyladenine glycosylase I